MTTRLAAVLLALVTLVMLDMYCMPGMSVMSVMSTSPARADEPGQADLDAAIDDLAARRRDILPHLETLAAMAKAGRHVRLPLERLLRDARAGLMHPPQDEPALELMGRAALEITNVKS